MDAALPDRAASLRSAPAAPLRGGGSRGDGRRAEASLRPAARRGGNGAAHAGRDALRVLRERPVALQGRGHAGGSSREGDPRLPAARRQDCGECCCTEDVMLLTLATLIILTNQGATPGVKELADACERASGHKVKVIQVEGDALDRRINGGGADLVTGNPETIEPLVKSGKVVASTVTPFVLAGLGLSVRAGAPKPDIRTVDAYKASLLAAKSIGYSRGCSGTHVAEGIAQLGLTEQLKAKTMFTSGGPGTDYLARGDLEIGIQP